MGIGRKNKRNLSSFVLVNKSKISRTKFLYLGKENVTSQNLYQNVFSILTPKKNYNTLLLCMLYLIK